MLFEIDATVQELLCFYQVRIGPSSIKVTNVRFVTGVKHGEKCYKESYFSW